MNPCLALTYDPSLIAESLDLYRAGKVKPPPIKVFDVSEIAQAYRYFNNKDRVGKVVVSMENPGSLVPVRSTRRLLNH